MTSTEENKVTTISDILESEIKESELPNFYYAYMVFFYLSKSK